MFWRVAGLATTSPVDLILDRESYTLEELLDEDDLIQECKSLNQRLIQFLKGREQVIQLVHYVIEEPEKDADDRKIFKYPFVACEIFTCEIDQIFSVLLEDEEIMNLLFSFLDSSKPHPNLLSGYFSKVVICLLVRRTPDVMNYLQSHQEVIKKLIDLIGITSIMEVAMKLVGADDQILMYHLESLTWLADTELLDLLVERLSPQYSADEHCNAAEALSAVARTAPSALATQLSSPKYVGKLFQNVLDAPSSKSGIIHSLSVCSTLLDPRRAVLNPPGFGSMRSEIQSTPQLAPEAVDGVVQRLGDLLKVLDLSGDQTTLLSTYGQLAPPFGIHRLKVVEFLAVLFHTNSAAARKELISLNVIPTVMDLFFKFPFNNMLHHQVESIINSCLESESEELISHLISDCKLVEKLLDADDAPDAPDTRPEPRVESSRSPSRNGYMGHLTRIANRLSELSSSNSQIEASLNSNERWKSWQESTLLKRNQVENVYSWKCGRPSSIDDRPIDLDEDEFSTDRDYDISNVSLTSAIPLEYHRYGMYDADDAEAEDDIDKALSSIHIEEEDDSDEEDSEEMASSSTPRSPDKISAAKIEEINENAAIGAVEENWFSFPSTENARVSDALVQSDDGSAESASSSRLDSRPKFAFSILQPLVNSPMEEKSAATAVLLTAALPQSEKMSDRNDLEDDDDFNVRGGDLPSESNALVSGEWKEDKEDQEKVSNILQAKEDGQEKPIEGPSTKASKAEKVFSGKGMLVVPSPEMKVKAVAESLVTPARVDTPRPPENDMSLLVSAVEVPFVKSDSGVEGKQFAETAAGSGWAAFPASSEGSEINVMPMVQVVSAERQEGSESPQLSKNSA